MRQFTPERLIIEYLGRSRNAIETAVGNPEFLAEVETIADIVGLAIGDKRKVLLCGNGGSAAQAQHIAAELVGRLNYERSPTAAIALTADAAVMTALANDYGYEQVFGRQIEALGSPGDVLIAISTSGRSYNILRAIRVARERQMIVVGFAGETGGYMAGMCDVCLRAPSQETALIQQMHMIAGHIICTLIEYRVFPKEAERV